MKSVSLLTAALAGAAGVALVAGPALAQPTANWNGPYVGLNTGWSSGNTHVGSDAATTQQLTGVSAGAGPVAVPPTTFATAPQDYSSSSWAGGGQIGFNHQMGHVVLGVEGDMDALGGRASQFSSYVLPATALTTGSTVTMFRSTNPHWTSTIRGRVGWATGPMLIYATGGLALADIRQASFYSYT
ncbi:MAG: outer membrane protein, partial [Caulobacteraceae bacterium]